MTESEVDLAGGCDCGAVRYRLTARPMFTHCCHCRWCQRETGSAFAINAIETACLDVTGKTDCVETPSESGNGQAIHRCPSCRIALWSHYNGLGAGIAFLRVGTLDDPTRIRPDIHIYTDTKQPWVAIPAGLPSVPEYYRRSDYWPAEAIARLKAARAGD